MTKSAYEFVANTLLKGLNDREEIKDRAEEVALDAENILGGMMNVEQKLALAFISGARWKAPELKRAKKVES
jgi:hypothetical protein